MQRNRCQFCRFKKCLQMGMVLAGRSALGQTNKKMCVSSDMSKNIRVGRFEKSSSFFSKEVMAKVFFQLLVILLLLHPNKL